MPQSGGLNFHGCTDASGPALECASLIILFSFIRRHNWHEKLEMGVSQDGAPGTDCVQTVAPRCGMAACFRVGRAAARPVTPAREHVLLAADLVPLLPFNYHHLDNWNIAYSWRVVHYETQTLYQYLCCEVVNFTSILRDRH